MAKKTTRKRMSKAPPKKSAGAKRDTYNIGGQTRAGKAIAKRRSRTQSALDRAMAASKGSRRK